MRRIILFSIIFFIPLLSINSQEDQEIINLVPLGDDLSKLFISIGRDLNPIIRQNSISSDTFGEAQIESSNFQFYLTIPTISLSTGDGVATVLSNSSATWDFIIKLPTLVDSALTSDESKEYYDISQKVFALPVVNIGFGMSLPMNFEVHLKGFYLPPLDYSTIDDALGNMSLDIIDLGLKVRKVLLTEKKYRPAFSIGLGYNYSNFKLEYKINSLTDFLDERFDMGALGKLDLLGDLNIESSNHIIFMDYHISKRLLFFTPFLKFSPSIYFTNFKSNANFDATVYSTDEADVITTANLDPTGEVSSNGFSLLCSAGFEIKIFYAVLHFGLTLDLQNPVISIGSGLENSYLDKTSVNFAFRLQF